MRRREINLMADPTALPIKRSDRQRRVKRVTLSTKSVARDFRPPAIEAATAAGCGPPSSGPRGATIVTNSTSACSSGSGLLIGATFE